MNYPNLYTPLTQPQLSYYTRWC